MSGAGAIVVLFKTYAESKRLVGDPDVITRGLIYGSEQIEISAEVVQIAKKAYEEELGRGTTDRKEFTSVLILFSDRSLSRFFNSNALYLPFHSSTSSCRSYIA